MTTKGGMPANVSRGDALRLSEVGGALLAARDAPAIARCVCRAVRESTGADGATFVLAEEDSVYYAEEDAVGRLWKGRRFPTSTCISGWAVTHRSTAVIEDVYADERIPAEAYRPTFVKSLAMTPLVDGDRVWGALGVYWSAAHVASEREVWILERLAALAAGGLACAQAELAEPPPMDGEAQRETDSEAYAARLLAVVAHDLRNPLSTIETAAHLLEEIRDEEESRALVRAVQRNAARANELVERVLGVARVSQGRLSLRLERTRLDFLCRSVVADLGVEARVRVEDEGLEALCDARMLGQALANLLSNALQHGDQDRPITVRLHREGDAGWIRVHNHGDPIPGEVQDSLFEPFRRYADDDRAGSLGLGLYITEQIVRAHGGDIQVHSSSQDGTSFAVVLPLGATTVRPSAG